MNIFFKQNKYTTVRAFTLLEVLASFAIVTLVILGPLTFSVNSATFSRQSKDVMVSTYLAQEALELLHHQYDTLYIACANDKDACDSSIVATNPSETPGNKAWRIFKDRLNYSDAVAGEVSCFSPTGCSYDFISMFNVIDPAIYPKKYAPSSTKCPTFSLVNGSSSNFVNYYVCSSTVPLDLLPVEPIINIIKATYYSHSISVESRQTFSEGPALTPPINLDLYQDDLVVTSSVSFRRSNGVIRTIKVVDFFHARS